MKKKIWTTWNDYPGAKVDWKDFPLTDKSLAEATELAIQEIRDAFKVPEKGTEQDDPVGPTS